MAKSIKLHNETYWDASSVSYKKQKLSDYLDNIIVEFDFILSNGITKYDDTRKNKGYYNKLTHQVTLIFFMNMNQSFNSQHLSGLSIPEEYAPSEEVYGTGTTNGGGQLQILVLNTGAIDLWSSSGTSLARGSITYYI